MVVVEIGATVVVVEFVVGEVVEFVGAIVVAGVTETGAGSGAVVVVDVVVGAIVVVVVGATAVVVVVMGATVVVVVGATVVVVVVVGATVVVVVVVGATVVVVVGATVVVVVVVGATVVVVVVVGATVVVVVVGATVVVVVVVVVVVGAVGVSESLISDGAPSPIALRAVTRNRYAVALVRPLTVAESEVDTPSLTVTHSAPSLVYCTT
jgi:hypothetical protein